MDVSDPLSQDVHFWMNMKTVFLERTDEEITKAIRTQFEWIVHPRFVIPMFNPDENSVKQEMQKMRRRTAGQRVVLHYVAHHMPTSKPGCFVLPSGDVQFADVLTLCGEPSCFVFDRDNAGELLNVVEKYVSEKGKAPDVIALFSCREGEIMPRSTDYPSDLFTACLTTPARIAMMWHSRHYYCFRSGPLQPLSQFFVEDMGAVPEKKAKLESIFETLMVHLRCAVETMMLNVMDKEDFVRLFRVDEQVSRLCTCFVLAMRILGCFGVHPVSYPAIADVCDAQEWHTFDLALDVGLYMLTNDEPNNTFLSQHHYLSQTLSSMRNFVDLAGIDGERPYELSYFPEILGEADLCEEACEVLAKYLDSSPAAIDHCLYFPIPKALFDMLIGKRVTTALLFCLIKLLAYAKEIRSILYEQSNRVIDEVLIPEIQGNRRTLIFILLSLLFKDCGAIFKNMMMNPEVLRDISPPSYSGDTRIWALFAVSGAVPYIRDIHLVDALLQNVVQLADDADTELQIALVSSLSKFVKDGNIRGESVKIMKQRKKIEQTAVETAMRFASSMCFITRRELFLLIHKYRQKNEENIKSSTKPFYEKIRNFLIQCANDPYVTVRDTVGSAAAALEVHSTIFDGYNAMLVSPVINLMNDDTATFSSMFDPKQEPVVTRKRNHRATPKCEQTVLKFGSCYRHQIPITTNLTFFGKEKIAFGDKSGSLFVKGWGEEPVVGDLRLTTAPLTDVQFIANRGSPLILSTDTMGSCYCASIESNYQLSLTAAFTAVPITEPCHVHAAVSEWPMVMYSYVVGGDEFHVRDLRADHVLPPIRPKGGPTISLQTLDSFSDYIAVCSTGFEFYDLRASRTNPMIELELFSPAFGVKVQDPSIPVVAIATEQAAVGRLDLRYPGIRTSAVVFSAGQTDQRMRAFAVQQQAETAAISHQYGITCVHTYNGRQMAIPPLSKLHNHVPNSTALVYHDSRYSLAFVHDQFNIVTVI